MKKNWDILFGRIRIRLENAEAKIRAIESVRLFRAERLSEETHEEVVVEALDEFDGAVKDLAQLRYEVEKWELKDEA